MLTGAHRSSRPGFPSLGAGPSRCARSGSSAVCLYPLSPMAVCFVGRSRVKVLETSYQQREERLRREQEELSARYLSQCQEAEQARAELTAQHQRRLAAAMQEKDQEMERLRELQR